MTQKEFNKEVDNLMRDYSNLISLPNLPAEGGNRIFKRYVNPVLTREHIPPIWLYDLNYQSNPNLLMRLGVNAVFNAGAIYLHGKYYLIARVEGYDRKSFFAVAESKNGIDGFRFWDFPVELPVHSVPETNVYDMRITQHEDGWIYGTFCAEYKDKSSTEAEQDLSAAIARCGIVRTKDLKKWERLPDLESEYQQRNVVIHPKFIKGKYALYTRPLRSFLSTGTGEGIGWALVDDISKAAISGEERIFEKNIYHTIKEGKNGLGPAPIETHLGWLNLAHGVRNTAAGLRYVLYLFLTDLHDPDKIIAKPGGYLLAPQGNERIGDVSNVLFSNGWIANQDGEIFIYYASSDTRMHVATTDINTLLDYCLNTPEDPLYSFFSVQQRVELIKKNQKIINSSSNAS